MGKSRARPLKRRSTSESAAAKKPASRNRSLLTEAEVEERRHILVAGIEQYNGGYFFQSHETWEELWIPSPWPVRNFLQGLIQMAAGFVHLMRHEYPGTVRLLSAAIEKLETFPAGYMAVDVATLTSQARAARDELEALGPSRFEEWDQSAIPRIQFEDAN